MFDPKGEDKDAPARKKLLEEANKTASTLKSAIDKNYTVGQLLSIKPKDREQLSRGLKDIWSEFCKNQ
jgi:hypothetical protein